jgi:hypothetical protein
MCTAGTLLHCLAKATRSADEGARRDGLQVCAVRVIIHGGVCAMLITLFALLLRMPFLYCCRHLLLYLRHWDIVRIF